MGETHKRALTIPEQNLFENYLNRYGKAQHQGTLNKAIRRMIRDCNDEILTKNPNAVLLLPSFSCHSLRHTYATNFTVFRQIQA